MAVTSVGPEVDRRLERAHGVDPLPDQLGQGSLARRGGVTRPVTDVAGGVAGDDGLPVGQAVDGALGLQSLPEVVHVVLAG